MHAVIIGSGLIGVTAAYFLRRRGYRVTVIDREAGPARASSFANGGLLTPSMAEPWNAPGSWRVLLGSLCRSDAALQLRFKALPTLLGWGISFLRNSGVVRFERNALANLKLALHSMSVMEGLRREVDFDYGRSAHGSLRIFRDEESLDRAAMTANRLEHEGLCFRRLSPAEVIALEPALAPISSQLSGGLHYAVDEMGDAHRFSVALADLARQQGVEFLFGREVSLERQSDGVRAVLSTGECIVADRYVVAAGSHSAPLLARLKIHLPVRPAKGYSVTFENPDEGPVLRVPIVDDSLHAVVAPLGSTIRVAGTAEFAGYDLGLPAARIQNLLHLVKSVLPEVRLDVARAIPWCGLRPMSADGVPLIGETSVRDVYVSTGHGHLGWTLAAGSADLLTSLISGDRFALDAAPFSPSRFRTV